MADEVDIAADVELKRTEQAIQNIIGKMNANEDSEYFCEDCDKPIPEARRIAVKGCIRCADCQAIFEKKQKHYR